jgi:hypothetical protein
MELYNTKSGQEDLKWYENKFLIEPETGIKAASNSKE